MVRPAIGLSKTGPLSKEDVNCNQHEYDSTK